MSQGRGGDTGSATPYSTARGRDWPSVRQFNVFVENREGDERFIDAVHRLGLEPFKTRVYGTAVKKEAAHV